MHIYCSKTGDTLEVAVNLLSCQRYKLFVLHCLSNSVPARVASTANEQAQLSQYLACQLSMLLHGKVKHTD